jgi:hypothetical protein
MSEFTSTGHDGMPDTYFDNRDVAKFSELSDGALRFKIGQYNDYLEVPGLMPRAVENGNRILTHLTFERLWREGYFIGYTNPVFKTPLDTGATVQANNGLASDNADLRVN